MGLCCVYGCNNRTDRHRKKGVAFHRFPKDGKLKKIWIKAVRRVNWEPTPNSFICTEHFTAEHVNSTYFSGPRLRENAIPTLFPTYPKHLQPAAQNTWRDIKRNAREKGDKLKIKSSTYKEPLSKVEERIIDLCERAEEAEQMDEFDLPMSYAPLSLGSLSPSTSPHSNPLEDTFNQMEIETDPLFEEFPTSDKQALESPNETKSSRSRPKRKKASPIQRKTMQRVDRRLNKMRIEVFFNCSFQALDDLMKTYLEKAIELQAIKFRAIERREQREKSWNIAINQLFRSINNLVEKIDKHYDK